jgi:predicted  nucleic acid-binding Zn-ribbon protein
MAPSSHHAQEYADLNETNSILMRNVTEKGTACRDLERRAARQQGELEAKEAAFLALTAEHLNLHEEVVQSRKQSTASMESANEDLHRQLVEADVLIAKLRAEVGLLTWHSPSPAFCTVDR